MKKARNVKSSNRPGMTLVLMMFAVVLLMTMGVGLMMLDMHVRGTAIRTSNEIASRIAADAGLEKGVNAMNIKLNIKPWKDKDLPSSIGESLPNCSAVFSYTTTKDDAGNYAVTSAGASGQSLKTVRGTLGLSGVFEHAILSRGKVNLKSNTLIDVYNSLDASDTDGNLKVATISAEDDEIDLKLNTTVNGEVVVGVGGDPNTVIKDQGATTGRRYAMSVQPPFPAVVVPPLPDKAKGLVGKKTSLTIGPADSGIYRQIALQGDDRSMAESVQLVVTGGDVVLHITGDIELGQGCEIIVRPDATLKLFVDGDIISGNSGGINFDGSPKQPKHVQLYGTGKRPQKFDIKAKNDWSGVVYAPEAEVQINAKGDIYGSFVSNNFEFKSGGDFYYDEALNEAAINDVLVRFVVKRWHEW